MATVQQIKAATAITIAIAETIRELGECPSGVLYSNLMSTMSLAGFEKVLATLKNADLIEVTPGHLIRWTGPMKGAA